MPIDKIMKAFLEKKKRLDDVEREGREATREETYDKEFAKLREVSAAFKTENTYTTTEGEKPCNTPKNRYKDIVPYDHTRVRLKNTKDSSACDYINASFMKGAVGGQVYIAAQGPMPKTVNDFWLMIWENDIRVMFMACREYEGTPPKLKCQRYWPNSTSEELTFGSIKVTLEKEETTQYKEHLIRHLVAKMGDQCRRIVQLHYQEWPDKGVPRCIPGILDLIEILRSVQPLNLTDSPPVLVHCSAGCGRTGTILVIDFVMSLLKIGKLSPDFSLYEIIMEMRHQRMAIVQSLEQYVFVHEAVAELFNRHLNMMKKRTSDSVDPPGLSKLKSPVEEVAYCIVNNTGAQNHKPARPDYKPPVLSKPGSSSDLRKPIENNPLPVLPATHSFAQPLPPYTDVQYVDPHAPTTAPRLGKPLVRTPSKSSVGDPSGATYSLMRKLMDEEMNFSQKASLDKDDKKNEYAYADPYQRDKWSLQAIALGVKQLESDYATVDNIPYSDIPKNSGVVYSEINVRDEVIGQQPQSKEADRLNILNVLFLKRQNHQQTSQNSCGPFEIAQVYFRDVNISYPNRIGKPQGKRSMKMAQVN